MKVQSAPAGNRAVPAAPLESSLADGFIVMAGAAKHADASDNDPPRHRLAGLPGGCQLHGDDVHDVADSLQPIQFFVLDHDAQILFEIEREFE